DSKRVAERIRALGYEVYVASDNDAINDKTNNPSPLDIYEGDISEIMACDIFVVNITGGLQDGTISEIGFVAGVNEVVENVNEHTDVMGAELIPIIAYTSNARLLHPQFSDGIPSASANHLVKGMIDRWGEWAGDEDSLIERLTDISEEV